MENIITYKRPIPFFKKLFGTIVIIFAFLIIIIQNILFGLFMMSFGVYLATTEGSQINLENKTYRKVWSIFGINFGKWKANPNFEYISVFKGKQKQRINSVSASTSFSDEVFLINLFYDRNKHHTFYRSFDKTNAFEIANHIKLALSINILDATERDQKWLD